MTGSITLGARNLRTTGRYGPANSDGSDVTERLCAPFVELEHERARDPVLVQLDHLRVDRDALGRADAGIRIDDARVRLRLNL